MALDILPIPASSVSVERLFSRAKLVATDQRARLGSKTFESMECLNYKWSREMVDYARLNTAAAEEVELERKLEEFTLLEENDIMYDE